jgi:AraC-like DNA-binding protein
VKAPARSPGDVGAPPLTVVTLLRRERARTLVRAAFSRRRAALVAARSAAAVADAVTSQLVDAVLVDGGAGEDAHEVVARAADFPSIPTLLITPLLPADAPLVRKAVAGGVAELLVEGVDEAAARDLVLRHAFTPRFGRALAIPPAGLRLESPLQLAVWQAVVLRGGRPVRTDQLARELAVSREHLSRSFAAGEAPTLKRVIDLVRLIAAAELAKNAGLDLRHVATILGFASASHLSATTQRLVGTRASSLARLRTVDLLQRATAPRPDRG